MKRYGQCCEAFCTFSLRIQILVHVGKNDRKERGLTTLVKTDKTHNHHFYINVVHNVNFKKIMKSSVAWGFCLGGFCAFLFLTYAYI